MVSKSRSRTRSRSRVVRNASREESNSIKNAEVRTQFKKSVSFAKKPTVKVTPEFKKKVEKSLEPHKIGGTYQESDILEIKFPASNANEQIVYRLGMPAQIASPSFNGEFLMFNPMRVLDAASVLFNNKTASKVKYFNSAGVYDTGVNSFNYENFTVYVRNSYCIHKIKNNTKRTWMIQLYEMAPKRNMDMADDGDALTQWVNALFNESKQDGNEFAINKGNAAVTTLYNTPSKSKLFLESWKVEKTNITIEPGQSYDHFVQGPQQVEYDYAKFWRIGGSNLSGVKRFNDIIKNFTRQIVITARLDMMQGTFVPTGFGKAGRPGISDPDESLIYESTNYYSLSVPDKTGGRVNVAAFGDVNFTNSQKRDCYFIKNWVDEDANETERQRIEANTGEDNIVIDA